MARPTAAAMAVGLGPSTVRRRSAWLITARSYSGSEAWESRSFAESPDDLARPAAGPFVGDGLVGGGGALWGTKLDQVLDHQSGVAKDPDPFPITTPVFDRVVAQFVQFEVALFEARADDVRREVPANLNQGAEAAKGEEPAWAQEPSRLRNGKLGLRERHHAVGTEDTAKTGIGEWHVLPTGFAERKLDSRLAHVPPGMGQLGGGKVEADHPGARARQGHPPLRPAAAELKDVQSGNHAQDPELSLRDPPDPPGAGCVLQVQAVLLLVLGALGLPDRPVVLGVWRQLHRGALAPDGLWPGLPLLAGTGGLARQPGLGGLLHRLGGRLRCFHQVAELLLVEQHHLQRRPCPHRGGPPGLDQQPDLAEEVARPQDAVQAAFVATGVVLHHLRLTPGYDVEGVGPSTLSQNGFADYEAACLEWWGCKLRDLRSAQARKRLAHGLAKQPFRPTLSSHNL